MNGGYYPQPSGSKQPPSIYKQMSVRTPVNDISKQLSSQGIITPNGSKYYNKVIRKKNGKVEIVGSRSNSRERPYTASNNAIFRSEAKAIKVFNETTCHYSLRAAQPVTTVTIGNWTGLAMIDTGSNKTLVSDKIVSKIGSPVIKDMKAEKVNTICGFVSFDKKISQISHF